MKQIYSKSSLTLGTKFLSNTTKTLLILFSLLAFTTNAWGKYYTTIYADANPSDGGKVSVTGIQTKAGTYKTSDSHTSSTLVRTTVHTHLLWASENTGYTFKGWAESSSDNSGSTSNPMTELIFAGSNNKSSPGKTKKYYAIFAGIVSSSGATTATVDFGDVKIGESKEVNVVFKHAHAGEITGKYSGSNQNNFKTKTGTTLPKSSTTQATFTMPVVFTPSCDGTRIATLTLEGDNGGKLTVTLNGNGVLHEPSMKTTSGEVDVTAGATPTTTNLNDRVTCDNTEGAKTYTCSNSAATISGNLFSATKAGDYTVNVKVAKVDCYYAEKNGSFTITVNRLTPELEYNNDGTTPVTIIDTDKQTIDLNSLKKKYTGNGTTFTYAIKSGTGGHLIDNDQKFYANHSGKFIITATSQQTDQYKSVSTDFEVNVTKRQPVVTTAPTATFLVWPNATLSGSTINSNNDGVVKVGNVDVAGTFAWKTPITAAERGWHAYKAEFTPTNDNWYEKAECDVYVQVKYAPEITTNTLSGSQIVYGQTLASSNISGTLVATDKVKNPNETVYGTYAWKDNTLKLDANDNASAKVVFTPSNDTWYVPTEFNVPLTVAKANPTIAVTATIVEGQALSEVEFVNATTGVFGEKVTGDITWADNDKKALTPEVGTTEFAINFASTNNNYNSGFGVCAVTVTPGLVFNGGTWTTGSNWSGGEVPVATDRVIVDADGTISTPVEVTALTINAGKTLTIADGGKLTVGVGNSLTRDNYGNIIVEAGGQLNLTTGAVKVNDFTLYSGYEAGQPKSGQVDNAGKLHPNGHAYFVLDLDPAGQASQGWYGFTVPFQVNALTGLARSADGINWDTNLKNEVNYAIETYHEDLRAQGQNGWKKYTGIMQPGVHHLITVDCEINRYRFEMIQGGVFNTADKHALQATTIDGGNNIDKGWNGLGNGTMQYISLPDNKIVQVLVHKAKPDNSYYTSVLTDTCKFAVGAAYFYQAAANGEMSIISANGATIVRAPQRDYEEENRLFGLTLSQSGCKCDNLTISCDDEATDEYTIGKDVQKMGSITGTSIARLWTNAKGTNLCAVNKAYVNDQAIIPLCIYAPKTGEYTLSLNDAPADVYLTRNGIIVWNLSMSEYTFDLNAGTDDTYALQVVRRVQNVATGIDATNNNGTIFAEKMIVNGQLFILRDGVLYDAQGKKVSSK